MSEERVVEDGEVYQVAWTIAGARHVGTGVLRGNQFSVVYAAEGQGTTSAGHAQQQTLDTARTDVNSKGWLQSIWLTTAAHFSDPRYRIALGDGLCGVVRVSFSTKRPKLPRWRIVVAEAGMNQKSATGNHAKYLSYKLAHERMTDAVEAGFPLEAIAIAESLITDRLLSFINFYGADLDPERSTLGRVAQKAAMICKEKTKDTAGETLAYEAEKWAKERNAVLHAIAKSGQGVGPKIAADAFEEHAQGVAMRGLDLVKHVKAWHSKNMKKQRI